jgi:UDP-N-acetylglucosamine--N-acetylmuramyl-(pentapeptide) pyrophosphoryl-undecaprenol N-acetylglucosamine transferase
LSPGGLPELNQQKNRLIVITGGGTGGHVYPALPLIRLLKEENFEIRWIGSRDGMERELVESWNIPYKGISTGKLRRYFSLQNLTDIFRIILGCFQSFVYLRRCRPLLVFSKGGFVSVPPVIAAAFLGIPVMTHESDVDPGLATKINSRFARKVFVAYEKSRCYYSGKTLDKIEVSGNPVRREFSDKSLTLPAEWEKKIGDKKLLVVIGGSLGARQLNQLVQDSLAELTRDYFVVHQMGEQNYVSSVQDNYMPLPYINEELPSLFQRSDLTLSRAGAGTLWELAASSTPALLLPLTAGSRGDQVKNAAVFHEAGMAEILPDDADASVLIQAVRNILDNPDKLSSMKEAASRFGGKPAEEVILSIIHSEEKI